MVRWKKWSLELLSHPVMDSVSSKSIFWTKNAMQASCSHLLHSYYIYSQLKNIHIYLLFTSHIPFSLLSLSVFNLMYTHI